MTSVRKHECDFTRGKSANKENELSNGKQNLMTKSSSGTDSAFDWAEKEAITQQRKLRLLEVRQKSKQIASQVLESNRQEERRQIEKLNRIKHDELLKWRRKQLGIAEEKLQERIKCFGEAQLAAERENAIQQQIEAQRVKNRRIALKRGKIAAEKIKENAKMNATNQKRVTICPKHNQGSSNSKKVDSSPESTSDTSTSSTSSSDSSVILVEKKKKPDENGKIEPKSPSTHQTKKASSINSKSPRPILKYNPTRYASAENSTATDVSLTDSPISDPPQFITKVSDLLGRKPLQSSPFIAKTYKLDKTPVANRSATKRSTHKSPINTVSSRLSRVIKTPTKDSGKSHVKLLPQQDQFIPEFVKNKPGPSETKKDSGVQTTPQHTSRVQFYDHANRFSKQYDGNIGLEEKIHNVLPLDAWEEARKNREIDEIQKNHLSTLHLLAENRTKVTLEKEQIRKNYDVMSAQLNKILQSNELAQNFVQANEALSESRLKQIAEERLQLNAPSTSSSKMSSKKAKPTTSQPRSSSDEAKMTQNKASKPKQPNNNDFSSDSTHSFLLDCVTERTNTICDDINRCRNDQNDKASSRTKIEALYELLNKVNTFRRILCEEIKRNNSDESQIDANQFLDEIEKVEEKQHEIMKEKLIKKASTKKQLAEQIKKDLQKREQLLKLKESCIDEKVRELYLREKKIKEQKRQTEKETKPSKDKCPVKQISVVSTNEEESVDETPVRIIINVNKNDHKKDKITDVIVNDVKWSDKLANSTNQVKDNVQLVPVSNETGKIYPKTPAKSKIVTVEACHLSSESTSLTAYLSPPDQIQCDLKDKLEQRAISNASVRRSKENSQIVDTELLHYIIRMLGMSRTSIERLNMSSVSSVQTPNSSIINISSNRHFISNSSTPISLSSVTSAEQLQSVDKAKLKQLAKFLAENNKLASSARKDSKESGASSSVWDDILSKKTEPNSKSDGNEVEKPVREKSPAPPYENVAINDQDEKLMRNDLIAKYDELAANCTKRIINLDSMISKVREEKQKLLENTLSSASSLMTGQRETNTEYMDYAPPEPNQEIQMNNNNVDSPRSGLSDSKATNAPSSDFSSTSGTAETSMPIEIRPGLLTAKNKLFGESKDSGVGNSRPVTSSDYRESPDLRQNAKTIDAENQGKLLQDALRESIRDPVPKDISKISYQISGGCVGEQISSMQEPTQNLGHDQGFAGSRDKSVKPTPPVAMARFSPRIEDELPHELSTISEVDTPGTSRLNATDATNGNEITLKNISVKLAPDNEALKLLYNAYPKFTDYIKSNTNLSQMSTVSANEMSDMTIGGNTIPDEKLEKLLEPQGSKVDELKYKSYDGNDPEIDSKLLQESELHMSYVKFPPFSEYAKETGLVDSASHSISDGSKTSTSTLPDIVNELKSRNILERSFEEGVGANENSEDLLVVHGNQTCTTESGNQDESLSDALENDLRSMGLSWVTAELKKSKAAGTSPSQSSDSSIQAEKSRRLSNKQQSPTKSKNPKRSFQQMNQSKAIHDSFVDKNLAATNVATEGTPHPTDEINSKLMNLKAFLESKNSKRTLQLMKHSKAFSDSFVDTNIEATNAATEVKPQHTDETEGNSMNLKAFLARELLQHSSMSSSSDSSLASIFLKSFLGQSSSKSDMPQRRDRTSTPVDYNKGSNNSNLTNTRGDSSSKRGIHSSSIIRGLNENSSSSPTFFRSESELSSVHSNSH